MKGLSADQVFPTIQFQISQVQDPSQRKILKTKILGEVESFEDRVARITARLDQKDRYKLTKKENQKFLKIKKTKQQ